MSAAELSLAQVKAIAARIELPAMAFIDGKRVAAKSGQTFTTFNPATGRQLAEVSACGPEDVEAAVVAGERALAQGVWAAKPPAYRKTVLKRLAALIDEHRHELAVLECLESGKPIRDCLSIDVPETARAIEWFGEGIDKLYEQMSPWNPSGAGLIVREPIGVVAAVLPWNFPLMMLSWKIGPALATGNSVLIKPAEQTSMTAIRIAELAFEAGVPAGVLNVLPGDGLTTGRAFGEHPRIGALSFTGSTEVGRIFLQHSAATNLKRVSLECGGKNPSVILSDARVDEAARHSVFSAFWNMGQNCTANSRIIVHKKLKDQVLEAMVREAAAWTTGDPMDPDNLLGSLVSPEHLLQVKTHVDRALEDGAKQVFQGALGANEGGAFLAPIIFDGVDASMPIARDEVFGPVTAVMVAQDDDHALELANDTVYGLQASLFTRDIGRAHTMARKLKAGTVSVNAYSEGDISTPFGGFKLSGYGGRDKSVFAYDQYLEKKTIWISLDD